MIYDILTIGDAFEDILVLPKDLRVKKDSSFASGLSASFELGEKIPLKEVDYDIGGSACNVAVGCARLGLKPSILSVVGDDTPAEKIVARLENESVVTKNILVNKKMKTNFSVIFRLNEGRTIFIYHGLEDYSCLRIKKSLNVKWIFLGPTGEGVDGLHRDIIGRVAERGAKLAWNPGALQIKGGASNARNLLKNSSILFLNKEEAIKFVSLPIKPTAEEAAKRLYALGPKVVVITKGKGGAMAYDGKEFHQIPSLPNVERIDSTGAGDSFAVGFLGKVIIDNNFSQGLDSDSIFEALKWGIINSCSVITKVGAQAGLLTREDISQSPYLERLEVEG